MSMLRTRETVSIRHVGWANVLELKCNEKLEINGKYIPKSGGSATGPLKGDIVYEMGSTPPSFYVTPIDKMVFVDSNGTERDSVSLTNNPVYPNRTSTNFDISTTNQIVVKGQITASANYSVAKVRLYSKSNTTNPVIYFEYTLSTTQPVSSGSVYNVVYTIQFSATDTSSGTNASAFLFDVDSLIKILAGVKASSTASTRTWVNVDGVTVYIGLWLKDIILTSTTTTDTITVTNISLSKDTTNYIVTITGSFTPSSTYSGLTWNVQLYFYSSTSSSSFNPSDTFGEMRWQRAMDFTAGVGYTLIIKVSW